MPKNPYNRFFFPAALIVLGPLSPVTAAGPAQIAAGNVEQTITRGDIEVLTPVTGLATAQDSYEIFAPIDGQIEDIKVRLFDLVEENDVLVRITPSDIGTPTAAADAKPDAQAQVKVKPEFKGILTEMHAKPRSMVNKGERLFTVSKKIVIIGKNTEPLYSKLAPGMTAELTGAAKSGITVKTTLTSFMKLKDKPLQNRLWLEVSPLKSGIRIGEQFRGYLAAGKSENALLVPRNALFDKFGRKYIIIEVETGLATERFTEVLKPGMHFLNPVPYLAAPGKEKTDGKNKTVR